MSSILKSFLCVLLRIMVDELNVSWMHIRHQGIDISAQRLILILRIYMG